MGDSEFQDNTTTRNNMVLLTVLESQDNTITRLITTRNNMAQLMVLESQDNTTEERDTTVKDTADTTDVSQPEDTEEGELATQEEDTLKGAESSTVKKNFFPLLFYVNKHV